MNELINISNIKDLVEIKKFSYNSFYFADKEDIEALNSIKFVRIQKEDDINKLFKHENYGGLFKLLFKKETTIHKKHVLRKLKINGVWEKLSEPIIEKYSYRELKDSNIYDYDFALLKLNVVKESLYYKAIENVYWENITFEIINLKNKIEISKEKTNHNFLLSYDFLLSINKLFSKFIKKHIIEFTGIELFGKEESTIIYYEMREEIISFYKHIRNTLRKREDFEDIEYTFKIIENKFEKYSQYSYDEYIKYLLNLKEGDLINSINLNSHFIKCKENKK